MLSEGRLDFAALAPRLAYRGRRRPPAQLAPAAFLAFDLLAAGDADVRGEPLRVRRSLLEQLAGTWRPPLQLTPQTADPAQARRWLEEYAAADVGVEGLVAKGANQRYLPGQRGWVELRIHNTGGHRRSSHRSCRAAGAADPRPGRRRRPPTGCRCDLSPQRTGVGRARRSPRRRRRPPVAGRTQHPPAGPVQPRALAVTRVTPTVVVEVEADTAFEHGRWRHLTRYRRLRLDLSS